MGGGERSRLGGVFAIFCHFFGEGFFSFLFFSFLQTIQV